MSVEEEIMAQGAGTFTNGNWTVEYGENFAILSEHERYHRKLNDITSYGALLDAIARLKLAHPDTDRFAQLSRRLIGQARTTHEVYATYCSHFGEIDKATPVPPALLGNTEYLQYFNIGAHFVGLAPTRRLGVLILAAVIRLAMNGPLPAAVTRGEFEQLSRSDFRAVDEPDRRLLQLRKILSREVCDGAIDAARRYFGHDERWHLFIERPDDILINEDVFKLTPMDDFVFIEPGGIPLGFETDVGNHILDSIAAYASAQGMQFYTLAERKEIERRIRDAIGPRSERFYDNPGDFYQFGRRRDIGRETVVMRAPIRTFLRRPRSLPPSDWAYFRAMQLEEAHCPLHIRTADDFLLNHDVVDNPDRIDLQTNAFLCYFQKKRKLADGEIVLDVVVLDEPREILSMALYIKKLEDFSAVRACISGRLLRELHQPALAPWIEALGHVDAPLSFLIDTHPQHIVDALHPTEALAWTMSPVEGHAGLHVLAIYPVGAGELPAFGMFRVGTMTTIDAVLKLFNPAPIHVGLRRMRVPIIGLSQEAQEGDWPVPEHLRWTISRYVHEEACIGSQTPEEMQHDQ